MSFFTVTSYDFSPILGTNTLGRSFTKLLNGDFIVSVYGNNNRPGFITFSPTNLAGAVYTPWSGAHSGLNGSGFQYLSGDTGPNELVVMPDGTIWQLAENSITGTNINGALIHSATDGSELGYFEFTAFTGDGGSGCTSIAVDANGYLWITYRSAVLKTFAIKFNPVDNSYVTYTLPGTTVEAEAQVAVINGFAYVSQTQSAVYIVWKIDVNSGALTTYDESSATNFPDSLNGQGALIGTSDGNVWNAGYGGNNGVNVFLRLNPTTGIFDGYPQGELNTFSSPTNCIVTSDGYVIAVVQGNYGSGTGTAYRINSTTGIVDSQTIGVESTDAIYPGGLGYDATTNSVFVMCYQTPSISPVRRIAQLTLTAPAQTNFTNALITQYIAELVTADGARARVTQSVLEAIAVDGAQSLVTQVATELLATTDGLAQVTQVATELICGTTFEPPATCQVPNVCVNPVPATPPDATLPHFPLAGDTIAYNMELSSVSLVVNERGNLTFPVGLYAFYEKNGSVWYKYKTANKTWTNDECLVTCSLGIGIIDSRTIFDCDGYPVTVYENKNRNIGIHYYIKGVGIDTITTNVGTSPNVVAFYGNIIAMFIPQNYTDSLYFLSSSSCFTLLCRYPVYVPGALQSFTLRQASDISWTFSFSTINNSNPEVYFANT